MPHAGYGRINRRCAIVVDFRKYFGKSDREPNDPIADSA
jgi:hypothetical protein